MTEIRIINMNGENLRRLIQEKWGKSFDVQLRRTQGKVFVLIMWKYLGQESFAITETQYIAHLDDIAAYISALGSGDQVEQFIRNTREKPRVGKAVSIPIDLGMRSLEWNV
jgi:Domain of unknown function (DUF3067)